MRFTDYAIDRSLPAVCHAVAGLLIAGLLWLIEVPGIFIGFTLTIYAAAAAVPFLWDFRRRRRYYGQLVELLARLDEKTLLSELAPRPGFLEGQIVSGILRQSQKYQNDAIEAVRQEAREYRDFLDTWVHEIKTPIASARWIVENQKDPVTLRIDDELRRIDRLVELALYYARSSDVETDFRVETTTLQALVSAALKTYSKAIIQAGGRIELGALDVPVCADRKSCAFIIGQFLSNAVKYRRENLALHFSARTGPNGACLTVADNGVGIDAADLPRVFEKGFTGRNGRRDPKSTGIGLYLCKRLCDQMNLGLTVRSRPGGGTEVTLTFPTERSLQEAGMRSALPLTKM